MTWETSNRWIGALALFFLAFLCFSLWREQYIMLAIPAFLSILIMAFFRPEYLFYTVVFLTPFSINLEELEMGGLAFYLPTEPLLFGFMIIVILGQLYQKIIPDEVLQHPVSRVIYLYLIWLLICSFTSTDPMVSFKFLVAKLWFIVPIYFFGTAMFRQVDHILRFLKAYLFPFLVVVIFTVIVHGGYGFEEEAAHWVMEPFYRDHTQYGAIVALFVPISIALLFLPRQSLHGRTIFLMATAILIFALVYSYSRAAWLSVFLAVTLWLIVQLRIRMWFLITGGIVLAGLLFLSFDDLMVQIQKNKTDSSDNLVENVESITNITTDASNLERINRWRAVFAMAAVRPVFGFGPGTYMFEYAPYQRSQDLTIISTNFGDVGNAHSEYLGPLAETGVPGFLIVAIWTFVLFLSSFRAYHRLQTRPLLRHILIFTTLALVTYFSHGMLNNFLDSDKASVPVFGCMAIIVALDLASRNAVPVTQNQI
ncbi:MAG: O-antigen ligase family protein [Saprospiraceae bacterium]|nr:O-antigen ligase family protein [Saprospiraceae bacterium]